MHAWKATMSKYILNCQIIISSGILIGQISHDTSLTNMTEGACMRNKEELQSEEEDEKCMNEVMLKHREELHQIITRQNLLNYDDTDIPPQTSMLDAQETYACEVATPITPNTEWSALQKLSSAERLARIDRMNLAEISDIRETKLFINDRNEEDYKNYTMTKNKLQPESKEPISTSNRSDLNDLSIRSIPVQQKLHFTCVADSNVNESGNQMFSNDQIRQYTKQLEGTLARFVEERDALIRNQAEFDKHASGIFPSLENLNNQLSRIVQGKMLHSQASPKECSQSVMDIQRERLQEMESELTRWRHDTVVNDQNHAIELQQIKAQIISLVASGKLGDEKMGLLSDSVRKLQTELQNALEEIVKRHCRFEAQMRSAIKQQDLKRSTSYSQLTQTSHMIRFVLALSVSSLSVAGVFLFGCYLEARSCLTSESCRPLT